MWYDEYWVCVFVFGLCYVFGGGDEGGELCVCYFVVIDFECGDGLCVVRLIGVIFVE